ncbi:uncharacterized protein LOC120641353 isoform X4 [Panicum virgatum]|uniref:uncharacterized protein LOC120641353 isoform X4 n=1 Tax=Panicum virgatum TaxID=38727 RepID=UPI0019D67E47|nr:uncharacterized protein LOC120641353 isoform X4 [Panicum virgatum]
MEGSESAPGRRAVSVRAGQTPHSTSTPSRSLILGPCLHAFPNNPMRPDQSQAQAKEARAGSVRNTGTSPCYGDKIKRRGAEAYAAARLRDGGGGGEGGPAAVSGAPGCGGAVPGCERRRRRARLLRGARRRGSRLRLLDVCQRQSKKLQVTPITPVATPTIARDAAKGPEPAPGQPRFASVATSTNQAPRDLLPPVPSPAGAAAPAARECPAYFRWIHEDLRPWRDTGVTLDAVERARRYAPKFRVTVVAGRLSVARYGRCFQTRDVFTQWGILQLLRRYPGRVPDLDLMFDCEDRPVVGASDQPPPPLFPDWSFWGWPELNIKPWEALRREIEEGNAMASWTDRAPYAYWKGNPNVGAGRRFLLRCNTSGNRDWNARIYAQPRHGAWSVTQEMAASFSGLGGGAAARIQGVGPIQAVHAQVQDLHRGPGLVREREVHPGVRLGGAHGAPQVPRLLLAGSGAAAPLLARPRPRRRHVPLHQVRRRLGQRPSGQGAGDRAEREQVRTGGPGDGPRLRLHAPPAVGVREAAAVQARRAARRRGGHHRVHGAGEAGAREAVHDGNGCGGGRRRGRRGALQAAAAFQCLRAGGAAKGEGGCGEASGGVGGSLTVDTRRAYRLEYKYKGKGCQDFLVVLKKRQDFYCKFWSKK